MFILGYSADCPQFCPLTGQPDFWTLPNFSTNAQKRRSLLIRLSEVDDMNVIDHLEHRFLRKDVPQFRAGDTLRVQVRIREGEKERLQAF